MRKLPILLGLVAVACVAGAAHAAIQFDQNVTNSVIYGSGNTNDNSWTVDQGLRGIEVGLRAHERFPVPLPVYNSNNDGTYNQNAGNDAGRPLWSFDWSINTNWDGNGGNLAGLTYLLEMDYDPTIGTNFQSFDPINLPFADHSFGNNGTADGAGVEAIDAATYAALVASSNLVQQSWRLDFFDTVGPPFPFNPNVDGTYTFNLSVFIPGVAGAAAFTTIDVIVGDGGAVPEATTVLMWGGLAACGSIFAWRKNKARA